MSQKQTSLCAKELRELFTKATKETGWDPPEEFPGRIEGPFFPDPENIFKAFELIAPNEVKYLILGQDPYFSEYGPVEARKPDAIGLSFLINPDREEQPPSSFQALSGAGKLFPAWEIYKTKKLEDWVRIVKDKKILLLNAALTVPRAPNTKTGKQAGEHNKIWCCFMVEIIKQVIKRSPEAKLYAFGVVAKDVICQAMSLAGKYHFCNHPARPSKSFKEFWYSSAGEGLSNLLYAPPEEH